MYNIEINGIRPETFDDKRIQDIVISSLKTLEIAGAALEIDFVSESKMQMLNKQFRSIDRPTDVLSFPQDRIPTQKISHLGNMFIAPDVVKKKNEKLEDVIKHGLLHLLGYDHESDEDKWAQAANIINCQL